MKITFIGMEVAEKWKPCQTISTMAIQYAFTGIRINPSSTARKVIRDSERRDGDVCIIPPRWVPDHMNCSRDMMDLMNQAGISKLATIQNYHVRELKGVDYCGVHPS